jgi:hypothetical protein
MTLEPLEPATIALPAELPKRSTRTGNIIFAVSSLISIMVCCVCALGGAAAAPAGFTALQNRRATEAAVSLAALQYSDEARFATATAQAEQFSELGFTRQYLDTYDVAEDYSVPDGFDDDYSRTRYAVEDGKYVWEVNAHQATFGHTDYNTPYQTNFYVSVEADYTSTDSGVQYGLMFRNNQKSYYVFIVTDNYMYGVFVLKNGLWITLIQSTPTAQLVQGASNRLTVVGQGSHFDFYINNVLVADLEDDTIPAGQVGVAIGLQQAGDHAVFEFDNLELRLPEVPEDFEIPQPAASSTPTAGP